MRWLGINEGQHDLSHKPDSDNDAVEKLTRINQWYCSQLAYMAASGVSGVFEVKNELQIEQRLDEKVTRK